MWVRTNLGTDIVRLVTARGVNTAGVEVDPVAHSGRVDVTTTNGQPVYVIHEGVAWDRIAGEAAGRRAVAGADAVCFGSLAQRAEPSRSTIRELLQSVKPGCLRVFDVNLRQHFHSRELLEESFALADVLKVNDGELRTSPGLFDLPGDEREQMAELARRHSFRAVACTRGERGSVILAGGEWSEQPAVPTTVADTVGAGDSFTAAMVLGLLAGWPLAEINRRASAVAAFVCSQPGGMPMLPDELREPFLAIR